MANREHRVQFDRIRLRALMYQQKIQTEQMAQTIGMTAKTFYTDCYLQRMMPEYLAKCADVLGCSVQYLTGEDNELRRPDKKITCEHCGHCKKVTDAGGKRRICAKWHIYRVQPDDHCSWGEWRSLKELME